MVDNISNQHVIKTSDQWNERSVEYWVVPRGCLCVELTPKGKTKLKVGEGNKIYSQLPYVTGSDLSEYYTNEEIDNIINNLQYMSIKSTNEYDSKDDLPNEKNSLGDVRFVKNGSNDPDTYVWNGTRWILLGASLQDIDLSEYVTRKEFNPVKEKVDEMYPKMHTHNNKDVLDKIEEPFTTEDKKKLDDLKDYDDSELRQLINESSHTHSNKDILDKVEVPFTKEDKDKLDSLENYDDSELDSRLSEVEKVAHWHDNKDVLDTLTSDKINSYDAVVDYSFEIREHLNTLDEDVSALKEQSHVHDNKEILDGTTATYTKDKDRILYKLNEISIFCGASEIYPGGWGYVPVPDAGQQNYFLRGDGTWAEVEVDSGKNGDKYKAGDGIFILSGEVTSTKFPFEIYAKSTKVKQYIVYGSTEGVGDYNSSTGKYEIPVVVSSDDHPSIQSIIVLDDPLYDGDYIDYEKQIFSHYRTEITNDIKNPSTDLSTRGINQSGTIGYSSGFSGWGGKPNVSDYYEIEPDARYEISKVNGNRDFQGWLNVNVYDEDKVLTRTIITSSTVSTLFIPQYGEKYIRQAYTNDEKIYKLKSVETPVILQEIALIPNSINSINIDTTNKPNEIYVETDVDEVDHDDPLSMYSGIIYNDGVLDVSQDDPTHLNVITVHFRDRSKDIILPSGGSTYTEGVGITITQDEGSYIIDNMGILSIDNKEDEVGIITVTTKDGDKDIDLLENLNKLIFHCTNEPD